MIDQIARLNEEQLVFLGFMATLLLVAVTVIASVIAVQVRKFRERQLDLGFKDDMLRRGLSVDQAVRLLSSRRPTWSQSLMALGDWAMLRVSNGCRRVLNTVPRVLVPCRRLLTTAGRRVLQWSKVALQHGQRWGRIAYRKTVQTCKALWRETRPALRWTMRCLSQCTRWLGDQMDHLVRRLAPNRP